MEKYILQNYALSFAGLPYRWGGDDPMDGFDCSGLVCELLKSSGLIGNSSDYTASELKDMFKAKVISEPKFGALAFFGRDKITHVGFCLDEYLMLEAGGGDSKVKTLADAKLRNAFIRIRPVMMRGDLVGIYMPKYPWEG